MKPVERKGVGASCKAGRRSGWGRASMRSQMKRKLRGWSLRSRGLRRREAVNMLAYWSKSRPVYLARETHKDVVKDRLKCGPVPCIAATKTVAAPSTDS